MSDESVKTETKENPLAKVKIPDDLKVKRGDVELPTEKVKGTKGRFKGVEYPNIKVTPENYQDVIKWLNVEEAVGILQQFFNLTCQSAYWDCLTKEDEKGEEVLREEGPNFEEFRDTMSKLASRGEKKDVLEDRRDAYLTELMTMGKKAAATSDTNEKLLIMTQMLSLQEKIQTVKTALERKSKKRKSEEDEE